MWSSDESKASDSLWWSHIVEIGWPWQPKPKPNFTLPNGSNYVRIKYLGTSEYGSFYLCSDCSNGRIVVVNEIPFNLRERDRIAARNEALLIQELNHPNIVRVLNSSITDIFIRLVFEKLDCFLQDIIAHKDYSHDPQTTKRYLHQMLSAVAYCHAHGILHRNLKPRNIQVDIIKKKVKIHFLMARPIRVPDAANKGPVGTRGYIAPEMVLTSLEHSTPVDVWSLGCIFAEMVLGHKLFRPVGDRRGELMEIFSVFGTPTEEIWPRLTEICNFDYFHGLPHWEPMDLRVMFPGLEAHGLDLLSRMLSMDPSKRISAKDALNHPYFDDLDSLTWKRLRDMTISFCCSPMDRS
ncbi:hypothetical protein L6164_005610 [Bauhinia variegata]|uniref:Uncharacterized protein n=1 Tax=Bauhinia variegata TaxID=167791 RepID=A0ACB9PTA2_BAUVA|nr:hypothetical protein L6164_005610 [Bauhinia variegata]